MQAVLLSSCRNYRALILGHRTATLRRGRCDYRLAPTMLCCPLTGLALYTTLSRVMSCRFDELGKTEFRRLGLHTDSPTEALSKVATWSSYLSNLRADTVVTFLAWESLQGLQVGSTPVDLTEPLARDIRFIAGRHAAGAESAQWALTSGLQSAANGAATNGVHAGLGTSGTPLPAVEYFVHPRRGPFDPVSEVAPEAAPGVVDLRTGMHTEDFAAPIPRFPPPKPHVKARAAPPPIPPITRRGVAAMPTTGGVAGEDDGDPTVRMKSILTDALHQIDELLDSSDSLAAAVNQITDEDVIDFGDEPLLDLSDAFSDLEDGRVLSVDELLNGSSA